METIKILLVEPSESIGEVIVKSLRRAFNAEVLAFQGSFEATEHLKSGETFSLILVRNQKEETTEFEGDDIAGRMLNAIYDLSLKTPLIVIGEFEHTYKKYALVSAQLRLEEINRLVLKALGLKKEDFEHLKLSKYIAFPVKHFYLMNSSPSSVYIKLVKKTGDEYVKRLHPGDNFNKTDLKTYEELGLQDFYIIKEEYENFMNSLFQQTVENLKKPRSVEEGVEAVGDAFVLGRDLMRNLGITSNAVAMIDQTILMMKNQVLSNNGLGRLLKKLLDDKMSYSYRRSYLIAAISHLLLPKMEWGSGDHQNLILEKICMVSYFHDICIEDERLLKISSNKDMKETELDVKELELVRNHANRAALLVQGHPHLLQGIDLIIKQHHGVSNGVGFADVLTSGISPMAIFFVVVEDFATRILDNSKPSENLSATMKEAIKPLKEKYQLPSYRKVVTEIENLISPKK